MNKIQSYFSNIINNFYFVPYNVILIDNFNQLPHDIKMKILMNRDMSRIILSNDIDNIPLSIAKFIKENIDLIFNAVNLRNI